METKIIIIGAIIVVAMLVISAYLFLPISIGFGMVGHWDFNEGTGNTIGDSTPSDNDGILFGGTWVDGVDGGGIYLDGIDDYISVGNDDSLNPENGVTLSVWFKPISYVGYGNDVIVTKGYSSHVDPYYQYHLGISGDLRNKGTPGSFTFYVTVDDTMYEVHSNANTWTAGTWYHVVGTFDGSKLALYVNGALKSSLSIPSALSMTDYNQDIRFGRFNNLIGGTAGTGDIDAYTPGTIDEIRIYERGLSEKEVNDIYNLI